MAAPIDPAAVAGGGETLSAPEGDPVAVPPDGPVDTVALAREIDEQAPKDTEGVQPYDFRHPVFLTPVELRRLRLRQEECIRALAARLSIHLRLEFVLQMAKLHTISYRKFAEGAANPAHFSLFKIEPLRGIGILEVHPRLGMSIVDRLLGGPAQSPAESHGFSEIEMALLDQAVQLILSEWCQHWADVQELRPVLLGHESNGQFLQTAPHDTVMLVLELEAKVADCAERMRIAIPCSSLEPLIKKLSQTTPAAEQESSTLPVPPKWNRNFDEVPVPVTAMWDDLTLTAREVANLKPGDVLPLDPRSVRQVKLLLANTPKFEGHLGTTGGKWAVAVTGVAKKSLSH